MSSPLSPKEESLRLDCQDTVSAANVFPLSSVQESLWVAEKLSPGTSLHNMPEAWHLRGTLDLKALRWAVNQILTRHETLRTAFSTRDGCPIQIIHSPHPITISVADLSPYGDRESRLHRWLANEARRPFDLSRAPLLRTGLFRLGPEEHVFLVVIHHLISDATSQAIFMRELAEFYTASVQARRPCTPELPIQYADYAVWQRKGSGNGAAADQLNYWRAKLEGPLSPIGLPTDRNRPAVESHRGATFFDHLPQPLIQRLKEIGQDEASTLFVVLLAAFKALLHRYTRRNDIIVGAPMSGRDRMEIEELIGLFVNTHALRTDLGGDPTFVEFLARVRQTVLEAYANQGIPLEHLMRALQPDRDLGRHPLFPVVFGLQASSPETWSLPGLSATRMELDNGASKFDWTLLLTETSNGCSLRSEYSTDLFTAETATRFVHHFRVLLEGIASDPRQRISDLPMLQPEERVRLLETWNQTASPYERNQCVHEIFEAQAAKTPDAPALAFEGCLLSYQEVNRQANQLARRLARYGVGSGTLVGIAMESSFDLIVALLATLKAGGAYVPFDRSYPQERLTFMLKDSGVSVLVTDSSFLVKAAPLGERRILCLDRERPSIQTEQPENLPKIATPEGLAYAIYTSGSTGKPKAAAIPHRAVVRLVRNTNYVQISSDDTFLQLAPVSFDASTFEIWGALLNGSKLVLCGPQVLSPEELGRKIEAERITILWLTAGLFHQMVDYALPRLQGLRCLLAGGEVLSVPHVLKALRGLENCQLINGYGPTENTTFTCCHLVPRDWEGGRSVPIGRSVSNTQVYILDSRLQPVPVGVPGDLYAGGDGLARGYLNQPELTGERFITNPFSVHGERLYRTGDLACWLSDGNIQFLGRTDEQVKIRGHRVEPGEIESVLLQHPGVREALVLARPDKSHSNRLIAYVVLSPEFESTNAGLREYLSGKLPHFEIPSHFVPLPELPLTPNGKVDRLALPDPELLQSVEPTSLAPRTPTEKALASIWGELLSREHIGIHENFFHLGGHSLLAMQVISRIGKVFGELLLRAIFESPTIAALAEQIDSTGKEALEDSRPQSMPRANRTNAAELLARMDELTDQQVAEMLQDPELKTALL